MGYFCKIARFFLLLEFNKITQVSQQCETWGELFKAVQKLKKHVEAEHKGVKGGEDGGDEGGWVWQETGGGVKGWSLVKV